MTDEYRTVEPDETVTKKQYVYYNGIPHEVLPGTETPKETKSNLEKTLELQRAILNPEDSYYILGGDSRPKQEEEKLITRSAAVE